MSSKIEVKKGDVLIVTNRIENAEANKLLHQVEKHKFFYLKSDGKFYDVDGKEEVTAETLNRPDILTVILRDGFFIRTK